jgi:hypothetical protein
MADHESRQIGTIGNYYGELEVKTKDGKYFWSIDNWNGHDWEEITKELYDALIEFENQRTSHLTDQEIE